MCFFLQKKTKKLTRIEKAILMFNMNRTGNDKTKFYGHNLICILQIGCTRFDQNFCLLGTEQIRSPEQINKTTSVRTILPVV